MKAKRFRKLKNEELGRKNITEYKEAKKFPVVVVLDNVRSLNNIGSIFRTADGFLLEAVYLCGITAKPPHREIRKTALGATETVQWKYFEHTIEAIHRLKEKGYTIIAIEQVEGSTSLDLFQSNPKGRYALIFGHEVKGVSQEVIDLSDYCIEIPQFGTKHSFNISVSVGIVLWDFFVKMRG